MSSTMPEPPGEEVLNEITEQARAELAHARPQGPSPKLILRAAGIVSAKDYRLEGFTPEWKAYYELLSKRREEIQWKEGGAFDTWLKAAYAHAKAKQNTIGALTVEEHNVIAMYESGTAVARVRPWAEREDFVQHLAESQAQAGH
jgi:hypothetical protein